MRVLLTPRMAVSVKRRLAEQNSKAGRVTLAQIRGAVTVMALLGTGWVFGGLAIGGAKVLFSYLFTITNSLQGFIIFLVRCVQYPEARKAWSDLFNKGTLNNVQPPRVRRFESWMFKEQSTSSLSKENNLPIHHPFNHNHNHNHHFHLNHTLPPPRPTTPHSSTLRRQSRTISAVGNMTTFVGDGSFRKNSSDSASTNVTNMSGQNVKERLLRTCDEILAVSQGMQSAATPTPCRYVDCDCKRQFPRKLSCGCQTEDFAC